MLAIADSSDHAGALLAKDMLYKSENNRDFAISRNQNNGGRKCDSGRKEDRYCNHCKAPSHTRDRYFKLHGFSDWYKELCQKCLGPQNYAFTVQAPLPETPFDIPIVDHASDNAANLSKIIQQEIA